MLGSHGPPSSFVSRRSEPQRTPSHRAVLPWPTRELGNQTTAMLQPARRPQRCPSPAGVPGGLHTVTQRGGPAQSHAECSLAGRARGSRYLDSSGKAPTAFWSEELEKAGERVRPQPPTHPWACRRRTRATQARRPGLELLQPTAAGLPGATVGAGGSEGFCLGEQPGREPPGERTAST